MCWCCGVDTVDEAALASDDRSHDLSAEEQRTVALFERSSASVVHITTFVEQPGLVRQGRSFRMDLHEIPQGSGSGFVWDGNHIVTNYHVIKDASRANIIFADQSTFEARLVGSEPDSDIAVLRVDGGKAQLKPLARGSSEQLVVGQRVLAIGNPFGLDQTLTAGIVSGLGREMQGSSGRKIRGLIQTDAAINPGNSGGPLLDSRGRLIGVNTMIASPSGAFAGVGFAIPVNTVIRIVTQLIKYGKTKRAYLGLNLVPDHVCRQLSRRVEGGLEGVLVMSVEPGSPADQAEFQAAVETSRGIRLGDEILSVGDHRTDSVEKIQNAVEGHAIGDEVLVSFRRWGEEGKHHRVKVTLAEREQRRQESSGRGAGLVHDDRLRSRL
eukprot:CAMPEP_0194491042 /NCGR_PEP_ID=MMETSP0253-20130528/10053_1 /TAXON_ID=2966 /ORGANISM="Noctiluca scintillans" /LENGTH=381 /DNA_ID=CAMNT_0039331729 /DNA_START=148 /DNA_END=1294 /DNA_ORIENTATION=-